MNNLPTIEQDSPTPCCSKSKWPNLNGYCLDHYDEFVVQPLRLAFESIEQEYLAKRHELYLAEVAAGLRPRAVVDWLAQSAPPKVGRTEFVPKARKQSHEQLVENDDPIENNI